MNWSHKTIALICWLSIWSCCELETEWDWNWVRQESRDDRRIRRFGHGTFVTCSAATRGRLPTLSVHSTDISNEQIARITWNIREISSTYLLFAISAIVLVQIHWKRANEALERRGRSTVQRVSVWCLLQIQVKRANWLPSNLVTRTRTCEMSATRGFKLSKEELFWLAYSVNPPNYKRPPHMPQTAPGHGSINFCVPGLQ